MRCFRVQWDDEHELTIYWDGHMEVWVGECSCEDFIVGAPDHLLILDAFDHHLLSETTGMQRISSSLSRLTSLSGGLSQLRRTNR